jgi:hypothetical protein
MDLVAVETIFRLSQLTRCIMGSAMLTLLSSQAPLRIRPRLILLGLIATTPSLAATPLQRLMSLTPRQKSCELNYLTSMGWQAVEAPGLTKVAIAPGTPCERPTLVEAQKAGDLQIQIPSTDPTPDEISQVIQEAMQSSASLCAYKFKVSAAVVTATEKLQANKSFVFGDGSPFLKLSKDSGWKKACWNGDCYEVDTNASPYATLTSVLQNGTQAIAECAGGSQLAQLNTQALVFGQRLFDRAFSPFEIRIGRWEKLQGSAISEPYGEVARLEENISRASNLGAQAFVGVYGYLTAADKSVLDSPANGNENYIIRRMTQAAADNFKKLGGVEGVARLNARVWQLGTRLTIEDELALLLNNDPIPARFQNVRATVEAIRKIFNENAFLSQTEVFVHPYRNMTFAMHLVNQLQINPRTPYRIEFYGFGVNKRFADRYQQTSIQDCQTR